MHSAQRHAILAIIAMIEQGLIQLKGLILSPGESQIPLQTRSPAAHDGYLSEEEEDRLDKLVEAERLEAARSRDSLIRSMLTEDDPA